MGRKTGATDLITIMKEEETIDMADTSWRVMKMTGGESPIMHVQS